jgi:hypothetical protein
LPLPKLTDLAATLLQRAEQVAPMFEAAAKGYAPPAVKENK